MSTTIKITANENVFTATGGIQESIYISVDIADPNMVKGAKEEVEAFVQHIKENYFKPIVKAKDSL